MEASSAPSLCHLRGGQRRHRAHFSAPPWLLTFGVLALRSSAVPQNKVGA